jgi:hypothetical protein
MLLSLRLGSGHPFSHSMLGQDKDKDNSCPDNGSLAVRTLTHRGATPGHVAKQVFETAR